MHHYLSLIGNFTVTTQVKPSRAQSRCRQAKRHALLNRLNLVNFALLLLPFAPFVHGVQICCALRRGKTRRGTQSWPILSRSNSDDARTNPANRFALLGEGHLCMHAPDYAKCQQFRLFILPIWGGACLQPGRARLHTCSGLHCTKCQQLQHFAFST